MKASEKHEIAKKAYRAGKRWAVIAQYAHALYRAGDIISCHITYDLARSASRRSGYDTFRSVRDLEEYTY